MAKWDNERRVLNHEHTEFWRHTLLDVTQPNLQRDVFPYDEVCRIDFDHRIIPISPAKELFITDTTFRDGQQARPPFTVKQIVDLFDLLGLVDDGGHLRLARLQTCLACAHDLVRLE